MKKLITIVALLFAIQDGFAGAYYLEPLSASVNPIGVHLEWSTYKELDVEQFVVEKSKDGITYFEIGEEKGTGFSLLDNKYHFLDMENEAGTFFYRLRELSVDGTISYSFIATAEIDDIYPLRVLTLSLNEISGDASVTFDARKEGTIDVYLTDISGKKVHEDTFDATLGINTIKQELTDFDRGFYILHFEMDGDHERFTLWKERDTNEVLKPVASTNKAKD